MGMLAARRGVKRLAVVAAGIMSVTIGGCTIDDTLLSDLFGVVFEILVDSLQTA